MLFGRRRLHPEERDLMLSIAMAHKERRAAAMDLMEAVKNLEEAKRRLIRCADILAGKESVE